MMEWKILLIACLLVASVAFAEEEEEKEKEEEKEEEDEETKKLIELQEKVNNYMLEFIAKATNDTGGLIDPLKFDDIEHGFEKEIGFVTVKGVAKLYDCQINGLSTLQMKGKAVGIDLADEVIMSAEMKFGKISASCTGIITLNDIGPKITLKAKIGEATVSMFISAPKEGGTSKLLSFTISELRKITVNIHGLGPMGWAAGMISSLIINFLDKHAARFATEKCTEYFTKELAKVPYPG